jgi:hypothetical protein
MSLRITVELPTISVMKMETRQIVCLTGSETLSEVKELIFNTVWNALPSSIRRHGSPDDVILECDHEEVCSNEQLLQRLSISKCFQATFKGRNVCDRNGLLFNG